MPTLKKKKSVDKLPEPLAQPLESTSTKPEELNFPIPNLMLGSHVEIARALVEGLKTHFDGHLVFDGGTVFAYRGSHWEGLADSLVRRAAQRFDGAIAGYTRNGPKLACLKSSDVNGIITELSAMLDVSTKREKGFFHHDYVPTGINVANGFIRIGNDGAVDLLPHSPDHRQLHTLTGTWNPVEYDGCSDDPLPEDSLLHTLLEGSFRGDPDAEEKIALLQEVAGVGIAGAATRLDKGRFILLLGKVADNGKSQILDMISGLFPPHAVSAISPEDWGDDRYAVRLNNIAFNAVAEIGGKLIDSAAFKKIVHGDLTTARDVYSSAVSYHPRALHIAGTNHAPIFSGGVDRGVKARLLPIAMMRSIPKEEQINGIGKRIATEESSLLLKWAIQGAQRAIARGKYAVPASSVATLDSWSRQVDPLLSWLGECCLLGSQYQDLHKANDLYAAFCSWADSEGYERKNLKSIRAFGDALEGQGVTYHRTSTSRGYRGLMLVPPGEGDAALRERGLTPALTESNVVSMRRPPLGIAALRNSNASADIPW